MAANPIEQIGLIRSVRARGIRVADLNDSDMMVLIDDALSEYLMYRPKITLSSTTTCITTVADQPNYDKPDDALWIIDVCWNPDYVDETNEVYQQILMGTWDTMDSTILMIDNIKMARLHKQFKGHWDIKNDEIYLSPTPSSDGVKVAIVYATSRTLSELDEIADRRFLDLVYYTCLAVVGDKKITSGGWKAGAYTVDYQVGLQTAATAAKGLEKTRLLIANSYGVRS